MFLNDDDLDEEDLDAPVVDLGMLPKAQQTIMGANPRGDDSHQAHRNAQYNERLARARATKAQPMSQRRSINNGMIAANPLNDLSLRSTAASQSTPIDVLSAEVEEMELEEEHRPQNSRQMPPPQHTPISTFGSTAVTSMTSTSGFGSGSPATGRESPEGDGQYEAVQQAPMTTTTQSRGPPAAVIDTTDLRAFLMRPGPPGAMVQCYIQRKKTGMARLFPTYEIYLKEGDKFLLAARKRKKNKSSNYLLSLDKDDLQRQSGNFFGKLRSNFIGTEFTLYDKGLNPEKEEKAVSEHVQRRQELACILYKQNVLGSRGPRKMKALSSFGGGSLGYRRAAACCIGCGPPAREREREGVRVAACR